MANIIYNAANPSGGFSVYINGQPVSHGLSQQEATDFLGRFYDALDGRLRILVEVDDDDESDSS